MYVECWLNQLTFGEAIMLNLAFQLIEAPVRRGDCGGRAIQGRKLGGVFRFPDLRLSSEELVG